MSAETEIAARMPWTVAPPESWWSVSGQVNPRHTFTDCLARVLPPHVTGTDAPVFEVLVYGDPLIVPASSITRAQELLLVHADAPRAAYYVRDQDTINAAVTP